WRLPGSDLPDRLARGHRRDQGLPARRDRAGARAEGRRLRRRAVRLRDVRAAGHLRALAQGPHLPAALPLLPQGPVQAAEVLPEIGSAEMTAIIQTHESAALRAAEASASRAEGTLLSARNLS